MSDQTTPTTTETPPAPADWSAGLSEDLKGYVQNKGFKDPAMVLDSYRNLEKLVGVREKLIKLPDAPDAPEWNDIYGKLGRPGDPKEYSFDLPKEAKVDEKFVEWARKSFHELGLSQKQAKELVGKYMTLENETFAAREEAMVNELKEAEASLKKEWGTAYEQKVESALSLVEKAVGKEKAQEIAGAFGRNPDFVRFLAVLAEKTGEPDFVAGRAPGFGGALTPEAAKQRIKELGMDHGFVKRFGDGGAAERAEMQRLHEMAYPDAS